MRCRNCGRPGYIYLPYLKEELCRGCFSKVVEKRIRSNLRMLLKGNSDRVALICDRSAASAVGKVVLKKVFSEMYNARLSFSKRRGYRTFVCRSLEEECSSFMSHVLLGKPYKRTPNPTMDIPQRELEQYCMAMSLNFRKQVFGSDTFALLRELENVRPGAMFGIISSLKELDR